MSASTKGKTHRDKWILSLRKVNLRPIISLIEECGEEWPLREQFWIRHYKRKGNLTNHSIGGEKPALGYIQTAEHRKKISQAQKARPKWNHSEETRRAIGAAHKGRVKGPMAEETKKKISATLQGRVVTPEARAKIAESNRRRVYSDETRAKISNSLKKAWEKGIERKPRTEEHNAKLAASNKARAGWKHTEESKAKMREGHRRNKER
jgi:hypothetical protein